MPGVSEELAAVLAAADLELAFGLLELTLVSPLNAADAEAG